MRVLIAVRAAGMTRWAEGEGDATASGMPHEFCGDVSGTRCQQAAGVDPSEDVYILGGGAPDQLQGEQRGTAADHKVLVWMISGRE